MCYVSAVTAAEANGILQLTTDCTEYTDTATAGGTTEAAGATVRATSGKM
jgi:hypothetical protein